MIQIMCTIRSYSPATDTASVELQGLGIVDSWLDGIKVAQPVNRGFLVYGAAGIIAMPDLHRICEASLVQVVPPGSLTTASPATQKTYTGHDVITTNASGNGSLTLTFPSAFTGNPVVQAIADNDLPLALSAVSTTGFTATVSGGPINGYAFLAWSASGPA